MVDDKKPKEPQGLPEGWKWVRLGEVIEEVKERNLRNDQLPLLTSSRKGIYLQDEYFNRIVASENLSNYKVIRKGQFTYRSMSDDGTFVFNRLENIELGLVSPAYYVFQVIEGCSGSFLKYFINNSVEVKKQIYKYVEGTTRTALRFNQLKNFIVPLPPLPEQRKIAQILETVDNAIEKTEKIIEKYKRIKQGLMQDLLTKGIDENGNIRSEKTHKFKDSPLGRIPEEWEVVRLGEISKTITKGTTPTTYGFSYTNDGINFIKIESIDENGNFIIEKFEHIDKKTNDYLSRSKLEEGDILFSIAGALGRVAIVEKSILPANTNQALAIIRLKEKRETTIKFLRFYLASFSIQHYIENILVRSAQSNLTLEHVSNFLIPLPPLSEQKRIVEILSQIDQAIEKEEKYKEKLERLKKGLMEDLLTGKVRVNRLVEGENHEMA
jgi:type I restriction enzyme S subunit